MSTSGAVASNLTWHWRGGVIVLGTVIFGRSVITLASQIVLARLLAPELFGALALILTIVTGMSTLATFSSKTYLVKQKEWSTASYDTAFTLEVIVAVLGFALLAVVAVPGLRLLGHAELTWPLLLYAGTLFASPLTVAGAYLQRAMHFRRFYAPAFLGTSCNAIVSLAMACAGYGIWSLVVGRLLATCLENGVQWSLASQKPRLRFDRTLGREITRFGLPLTGAAFLIHVYWHVDYLIVDRFAGAQELGFYFMAFSLCQYMLLPKVGLNQVAYPILAQQEGPARARSFEKLTWLNAVLYLYMAAVLVGSGDYLIGMVFGWKWYPCVPALKVLAILTAWRGVTSYGESILWLTGGNTLLFRATLATCLLLPALAIPMTLALGIVGTALSVTFTVLLVAPFLLGVVERRAGVRIACAVRGPLFAFCLAAVAGHLVQEWTRPGWVALALSIACVTCIYTVCLWQWNDDRLRELYHQRTSWLDLPPGPGLEA
ncbi:MAG: oligosaccharide flippase family protein [Planctomycetes bacterium]|nr:oligosaccharide flippase family protein [Planctomycetota bacterium]